MRVFSVMGVLTMTKSVGVLSTIGVLIAMKEALSHL